MEIKSHILKSLRIKTGITMLFIMVLLACNGQEYKSFKQKYLKGYDTKFTPVSSEKSISVNNDTLFAELPTGDTFKGVMRYSGNQEYQGKYGKRYDLGDNDLIVIYEDEIFLNIQRHKGIAITYFLPNYKKPNSDQERIEEEKAKYEINLKIYGKFTADCIKEGVVKPGMKGTAVLTILGTPKSINKTETKQTIREQLVYDNMYVYLENGEVTTIQTRTGK